MNDSPRTLPIHASLSTPILLLGAERQLVLLSGLIAAVLVLSLARPVFVIVGALFWLLSLAALRRAAKFDPQFSRIYLRHTRYADYYAAQSRATAAIARVHEQVPC